MNAEQEQRISALAQECIERQLGKMAWQLAIELAAKEVLCARIAELEARVAEITPKE